MHATTKLIAVDRESKIIRLSRGLTLDRTVIEASDARALVAMREKLAPISSVTLRHPVRNGYVHKPMPTKRKKRTFGVRLISYTIAALILLLIVISHG